MPVIVSKATQQLVLPSGTTPAPLLAEAYYPARWSFDCATWYEGNTVTASHGFQGSQSDGVVL